jgi:TolB-like protein/DNA-binding winged helix-turn-helix (wHTH) protein/Tfp pilus assembly protein PilF
MSTPNPYDSVIRFSVYELDYPGQVLRKSGMRLRCQGQPLQVLAALVEKPGVLVTREELRQRVWPEDTFVDFDQALNTAVKKLRHVLNDDADAPSYIETVPRRGYRFIGPILPAPQTVPVVAPAVQPALASISTDSSPPRYRRIVAVITLAIIFASAAVFYLNLRHSRPGGTASASQSRPVMLAVLPFKNMTSDPKQDGFSDGMTEETTTRLARLNSPRFHVIARTSAMKYKDARKSVDEIARELHADYLLEGSIQREGQKVRISSQLIRAADQSPRWTQEYNFNSGDALSLETHVANAIAGQLSSVLDPSLPHRSFDDDSMDSYWRGLAESSIHTPEGLQRIVATFEKAVIDDPNCPQPLASLAHVYERGTNLGFLPPRATYAKARAAAEQAIQIDPSLPESHVYLADAMLTIDYDWRGAQAEIQKALELNANDPMAHEWNGIFLGAQNKPEQGLPEMQRAVELDPLNADRKIFLAGLLMMADRRSEAEEQLKAALQLDPASVMAHGILIDLYTSSGRHDDAIAEWSTFFYLQGQPDTADSVKSVYRQSGFDAARHLALHEKLALLTRLREHRYISAFSFAVVQAQLGNKEQAIVWLQKAYEARDVEMPCLLMQQNSEFAAVKNDPRVVAIVEKIRPPE